MTSADDVILDQLNTGTIVWGKTGESHTYVRICIDVQTPLNRWVSLVAGTLDSFHRSSCACGACSPWGHC
jgi:hypothetical protein